MFKKGNIVKGAISDRFVRVTKDQEHFDTFYGIEVGKENEETWYPDSFRLHREESFAPGDIVKGSQSGATYKLEEVNYSAETAKGLVTKAGNGYTHVGEYNCHVSFDYMILLEIGKENSQQTETMFKKGNIIKSTTTDIVVRVTEDQRSETKVVGIQTGTETEVNWDPKKFVLFRKEPFVVGDIVKGLQSGMIYKLEQINNKSQTAVGRVLDNNGYETFDKGDTNPGICFRFIAHLKDFGKSPKGYYKGNWKNNG